jgi:hypothetical protein
LLPGPLLILVVELPL